MALSETAQLQIRISAQSSAGAVLSQVEKQFGSLQSTVAKVATAIAGAFAIRDVLQTTERFTKDLDALADAMGLSGAQASSWNYQARYTGIAAEDLSRSFQLLANNVYSQSDAIAKGTSDFDKLGISVLTTSGQLKPMDDLLASLRERMRQLDAPSQAVLERQLFGRSGGRLHDFLLLTDADVKRLTADLDSMGMTLGTDVVAAMEQQQREMNRLGFLFDSIKLKLGQALIPMFLSFAKAVTSPQGPLKSLLDIGVRFLQWVKEVADKFGVFLQQLKEGGLGGALTALWDGLKKVGQSLKDDLITKLEAMGVPVGIARAAIEGLALVLQGLVAVGIVNGLAGLALALAGLAVKAGLLVAAAVIFNDIAESLGRIADGSGGASDGLALVAGGIGLVGLAMGRNPFMLIVSAGLEVVSTISLIVENWDKFKAALMTGMLGDIPLFGALFSAIKNAVTMMGELREGFEQTIDMVTGRRRPAPATNEQRPATSVDIFDLYTSLLGREPEDTGAIIGRVGQPYQDVYREIYNSIESMAYRAKSPASGLYPGEARAQGVGGLGMVGGSGAGGPTFFKPTGAMTTCSPGQAQYWDGYSMVSCPGYVPPPPPAGFIERFATGGIVMPRPGGTLARIGEAGQAEAVIPLDRMGGMGEQNINVVINGNVDSRERVRELAREVGAEIMKATRGQRNFSLS